MTNYIANHTKKKRIPSRKEAALRRLIDAKAPIDKLIAAAEQVRDARIRVLRVRRSLIAPTEDADLQYAKVDSQIETIRDTPATSILQEFGYTNAGPQ
ncbi:MAG: hypothetical protein Aurels2KO_49450 [Aureliella sp.]